MKRVFVTGASSELMRSVLSRFPKEEYRFIALSRTEMSDGSNISWIKGDLLNPSTYQSALEDVDMIIHAAAITHSRDPEQYWSVNVEGTRLLVQAANYFGNPRVVLISSRTASRLSGAYGASKLESENVVKELVSDFLIIRPAEVFGGTKGEGIDGALASAIKGGLNPCPVGLQSRMYPIHTTDAAVAIAAVILDKKTGNSTVYVNGSEAYSFYELLKLVESETGRRIWVIPIPKLVMKMAALFSTILNIDLGFAPDQVDRLYSPKQNGAPSETTITIRQHIKSLIRNEN
jgi:NADH dehydrogenase